MCELALLANFFIDLELRPKTTEHGLSYNNFQAQTSHMGQNVIGSPEICKPLSPKHRILLARWASSLSCQKETKSRMLGT